MKQPVSTHPNAYRAEAADKRKQAEVLLNEAQQLESQADSIEGVSRTETKSDVLPKGYKRDKNGKLRNEKGHYVKESK